LDEWFGAQRFRHVLAIGGNHDFALEYMVREDPQPFRNAELLLDSGITIDGVRFWGSPWTPDLPGWAWYADSAGLRHAWGQIPAGVDVLITHTPPAGILDISSSGRALGCAHLLDAVERVRPRLHCFGASVPRAPVSR